MHADILQDLAVVMIAAGLVTVVAYRYKQPVVLGYILAGFLIGPHAGVLFSPLVSDHSFPVVHDEDTVSLLAELGIIMLMFSLGMHFSIRKLLAVGRTALIAATLEILLMVWIGYEVGRFFGWSNMDSLFLGAILSISSTTIITKALSELKRTGEPFAQLIFGILIVEDLLGIAMLALLSGVAMTGAIQTGAVVVTVGKLAIFLAVVLVVGLLLVPRLLNAVGRFQSGEMMLVTVLGLCFGTTLLAAKLGYSIALGAFLIGAVIAECRQKGQVESLIEPVRDMFSAIFFVAVGMLIDPRLLIEHWLPIAVITLAVVVGKVITCSFGAFISGHDTRTSLRVGMGLAQIGEFSFIIAQLGLTLDVTSDFLYPIAVMVSAVTTLMTPYLIRHSDNTTALFERAAPKPLLAAMALYSRWVARGSEQAPSVIWQMVRRTVLQIALNMALITGLYIIAAFGALKLEAWDRLPRQWVGTLVWLGATLVALPLLAATFRKMRAMSMLAAEVIVSPVIAGRHTAMIRAVVANVFLLAGTIGLGLVLMLLSAAILPPLRVLIALGLILAGIAVLKWRSFIKIYASAQFALEELLQDSPPPPPVEQPRPMPPLLRQAQLEMVQITDQSPAAGRLIRELDLRAKTGASAVAIERNGQSIVNPGPDVELHIGDKLLLLGSREQLEAAGVALAPPVTEQQVAGEVN